MTSKERLHNMLGSFGLDPEFEFELSKVRGFDPATISEVTDGIHVTAADGVDAALAAGHYVINVADELESNADAKIIVQPYSRDIRSNLDAVAQLMDEVLSQGNRTVAVHCAMGMERSVLAVVWYLTTNKGMTVDNAYDLVKAGRPIALDRREWAGIE